MLRHAVRSEAGQSVILFVVGLIGFVGIVAAVLDVGQFLVARRNAQNTADAAALAGASMLPDDPDAARELAAEYAATNGLEGDDVSISIETRDYTNDTVRVTVSRGVDFSFATVLDLFGATTTVSAAASRGSVYGSSGLAPFAVIEDVFAGLGPGDTTTLKYNATNSDNGNFLPLSLDSTGASEYENNTKFGSDQWLCSVGSEQDDCPSQAPTEPGNVIGPTRQALQWITSHTSAECDSYSEVFVTEPLDPGRPTLTDQCNRFINGSAASYRVFLVPIIDELCNGRCDVNVLGFAMFFIESYTCSGSGQGNSCDLNGRYAKTDVTIDGAFGPFNEEASVTFVRLVE
jgi:Flp pilus assembly protein TadG